MPKDERRYPLKFRGRLQPEPACRRAAHFPESFGFAPVCRDRIPLLLTAPYSKANLSAIQAIMPNWRESARKTKNEKFLARTHSGISSQRTKSRSGTDNKGSSTTGRGTRKG